MRKQIQHLLASQEFDVLHADQISMAQFVFPERSFKRSYPKRNHDSPFLIFDAHNAVWTIVARIRQSSHRILEPFLALEERKIKRYEGMVVERFDETLSVSEVDQELLEKAWTSFCAEVRDDQAHPSSKISTIPIAVDAVNTPVIPNPEASSKILALGTLHYPPNADGIRWFIKSILPLIVEQRPEVKLTVIGKNPPADFFRLENEHPESIRITGYVPDLKPYLEETAVMVVPVRVGGGMRVRILEAFAQAIPVVTTTIGLEGIQAREGRDVLIGDSPGEFADCVLSLLEDHQKRIDIGQNGRRLVEEKYDWEVVLMKLDQVYARA
jgi:glycosyltransferase involved in cell wall biosynthesis